MSDFNYDYQRYAILFVDDEDKTRKYFRRLYGETFRILEAADGLEALSVFRAHASEIGIIVTDQRMPNETGVGFLAKITDQYPDVVKILSTAYSDLDAAINSVNKGGIYRYITKPWEVSELEVTLRRAMEFYLVKRELNGLMSSKLQALGNVIYSSRLAAFALAPLAAGLPAKHVAEAVSSFVRLGAFGAAAGGRAGAMDAGVVSWRKVHEEQKQLAGALEETLKDGFAGGSLADRVAAFAKSLPAGDTLEVTAEGDGFRLTGATDAFPRLLAGLFGVGRQGGDEAVPVLAALMGIYDAGASVGRQRGDALVIDVRPGGAAAESTAGSDVARWLFDDDLLISSALGLL
ncbi:response regulator [Luteolibacter flavescens]|uniref:Response regulator n=1 Tax=Luteolibacter flavescens TaxID=1859460 RepID=A0ABT3FP22_9BACT|nr:response regulator [Luteolibacter flavescens]MCW1884740.1 response regulator [Luteolibacter flavescens]